MPSKLYGQEILPSCQDVIVSKSLQIKIRPLRICDDAQRTFSRHKVCETSILNFVRQRLKNKTHNYIMLHM
ncbi:unnamed protein product [Rhizophagus irregularis]|nr:unnamed protein product [Rhizophagus irregularis]